MFLGTLVYPSPCLGAKRPLKLIWRSVPLSVRPSVIMIGLLSAYRSSEHMCCAFLLIRMCHPIDVLYSWNNISPTNFVANLRNPGLQRGCSGEGWCCRRGRCQGSRPAVKIPSHNTVLIELRDLWFFNSRRIGSMWYQKIKRSIQSISSIIDWGSIHSNIEI